MKKSIIQCLACSHYCVISKGKTGICGVRQNVGNRLDILVYGRPCALHIDPIEKKPLYHFFPGTEVFSLGTFGCNLGCSFCQNWEISQASKGLKNQKSLKGLKGEAEDWKKLLEQFEYWEPKRVVEYAKENNCLSIAYTYNEPTIWIEYAYDIAKLAKAEGIKNVYVSNGYMSKETVEYISSVLDAINIDLKSFRRDFYLKNCKAKLQPVLDNIKRFAVKGIWVEVTTLVIPHQNDSADELKQIAEFLASVSSDIPWHLSAFHGDYQMRDHESTDIATLFRAKEIGRAAGLKYVYLGNVNAGLPRRSSSKAGKEANTYCPKCGELLVERGYMSGKVKNLIHGKCGKCGEVVKGVFE